MSNLGTKRGIFIVNSMHVHVLWTKVQESTCKYL